MVNLGLPTVSSMRTLQARGSAFECSLLATICDPNLPSRSTGRCLLVPARFNSECPRKNGERGKLGQERLEVGWEVVMFLFNIVNLNV